MKPLEVIKLNFIGEKHELTSGIDELSREYGFERCSTGIPLNVEITEHQLEVRWQEGQGHIGYSRKHQFFRALGLFLESYRTGKSFDMTESPQFDSMGAMFDLSRNGVLKVSSIETFLRYMAVIGMDRMMLYMEDTFTIAEQPYFGYFRGRYSFEELKQCDDYADQFGIEIVPVIQTLGHLQQFLKWTKDPELKDTEEILLIGSDKTYELIRQMVHNATAPFRSKQIHLGMDEAEQVGLGRYLRLNGFENRFDLMVKHLEKVVEITSSLDLEPMIWSDMFFKIGSAKGEYYDLDAVVPKSILERIPPQLRCIFWSYYHEDEDFYREMIRKHEGMGAKKIFAGGIWSYVGFIPNFGKTFATTNAAMEACKKEDVSEVFATLWGDNGTETDYFTTLPALQLFAEHAYTLKPTMERVRSRFEYCAGASFEAFLSLQHMDEIPGISKGNLNTANPSKPLLWQDILLGVVDKHLEHNGDVITAHYEQMYKGFTAHQVEQVKWGYLFQVPSLLADVLRIKANIGNRLKRAYERKDRIELTAISMTILPELAGKVAQLRDAHRRQWFLHNKPNGWEVLDHRYGGLLSRIDSASWRINDYLYGRIEAIVELEEERLLYPDFFSTAEEPFPNINSYSRISSASNER